jgi:hypothetical protein
LLNWRSTATITRIKCVRHDVAEILLKVALNTITLTRFNGNTSYIWAVLIKLHDSHRATYDDRRKSYELLKHQALK